MRQKNYMIIAYRLIKHYLKQFFFQPQGYLFTLASMGIWGAVSLFVTGKILPQMGTILSTFGLMQFSGVIAGIAMQVAYRDIFPIIMDFEDKKNIYHELGFPIPAIYLFLSKLISQTIAYFIVCISLIPVCKIILWNEIIFSAFNWTQFFIALISACLLFSSMVFFLISFIPQIRFAGLAWAFFIFPLWFLGGFQFSWNYLYQCNKIVAYLDFLNPIIYINESLKIALIQIKSFLPFQCLIGTIFIFTIVFFSIGYMRIKKRLDILD